MKNKLITLFLCFMMLVGTLCTFVSATEKTYGLDNLTNEKGDLKVAFIGGSITVGGGADTRYSTQLCERYFKTKYPNRNVIEINAGIGGTGSDLGLYRINKDVTPFEPDVVFVEFAVNDSSSETSEARELKLEGNMEGIVRQLSNLPKQPVIIFIYTTRTDRAAVDNAIRAHHKVAEYYGIGEINLNEYIRDQEAAGKLSWEKLSADGTHPNAEGHAIYADYMKECFDKSPDKYFRKLEPREKPLTGYEYGYVKANLYKNSDTTYTGSWTQDKSKQIGSYGGISTFERGCIESSKVGDTATFRFKGRLFGLYCARGDIGGSADYVLDAGTPGEQKGTVSTYYQHNDRTTNAGIQPNNMPVGYLFISGLEYGDHTITFTTTEPTHKAGFDQNTFAIGYYFTDEVLPDSANSYVALKTGSSLANVNGETVGVDCPPVIVNDRALVPVRFIAENLGAEVSWGEGTGTVTITGKLKTVSLEIGSNKIKINGKESELDVPAQIIESRTMVPIRAITEALGKTVVWNNGIITVSDAGLSPALSAKATSIFE